MQVQAGARRSFVLDFDHRIAQSYEEAVGSIASAVPQAAPGAAGGQDGGCSHFYPGAAGYHGVIAVPTMFIQRSKLASYD
jgi:hypothetical protein